MADLRPEASNSFKLPLFEISIVKDKKMPRTLVHILSPGDARGICYIPPKVQTLSDDVIEKSAIQLPIYNGFWQLYASHWYTGTSH
jgi:hypothetical protein